MTAGDRARRAGPVVLGALPPASLLAVDPAGWYPFGPVKWLLVSALVLGGAARVLAVWPVRVPRPLGLAVGALLAAVALGAVWGVDPWYAWIGSPERRFGAATWLLCATALAAGSALAAGDRPAGDRRAGPPAPLMVGLAVAAAGVGAVAVAEALGWEPDVLDVSSRLSGTLGSPAYLGAAVALLLPIAIGLALDGDAGPAPRLLGAAAAPALAVALLGSGARAAWAGAAVAALTIAFARRAAIRAHLRDVGAVAATCLVGLVVVALATPAGSRLAALGDAGEPGGQGRLDEWRIAAATFRDHPLVGVGPEGYRVALAEHVDAAYEREHGRDPHPDRAHAAPLDMALAGGVPAALAWLAVVALAGRSVLRACRAGRPLLAGLACGLVAHVAGQLVLFPVMELEPLAWLLAGVVVAAAPPAPVAGWRVPRAIPAVLGALAVVALLGGAVEVVADRRAAEAADALARGDQRAASDAADAAVDLRPDVVRLHLLAARAAVADDQGTVAGLRHVDAARDVSPGDPIARLERLRLLVNRAAATGVPAHVDAASAALRAHLARDPNSAAAWELRLRLALLAGDDEARRKAEDRLELLVPTERREP